MAPRYQRGGPVTSGVSVGGWQKAEFKGKTVWAKVSTAGELAASGGRVPIRYSDKPGAKIYRAGASRLGAPTGEVLQLDEGVSADKAAKSKSRGSGFGKAGTRSQAQAQAAAVAANTLIASLDEQTAVVFTDGGCRGNPGPAGSGVSLRLPDGRRAEAALSLGRGTNNIAELNAVGVALDLLDEAELAADAAVALLTDSKYVIGVLAQGWKAKANAELIGGLRTRLAERPGLKLHWVAGHVGVGGNESADALANAGIEGRSFTRWS